MKVLIDTNVYLSYVLAPDRRGVITSVVFACLSLDEIDLIVPPKQIVEFVNTVATKRYFRSCIPQAIIDGFVVQLKALSELQPVVEDPVNYSRDLKDDYLIAYGVVNEADYLITGDQDLLVLQRVGELEIGTPARFADILRNKNLLR